jgi:hypothetical protein
VVQEVQVVVVTGGLQPADGTDGAINTGGGGGGSRGQLVLVVLVEKELLY